MKPSQDSNGTRVCGKCKRRKPYSEYYKSKSDKAGFQGACKKCQAERTRLYALHHPGYFRRKGKERYDRVGHKEHYTMYKESYLRQRRKSRLSVRGRLHDLLDSAKRRARKKRAVYKLDYAWLESIYYLQKGRCALTDLPFDLSVRKMGHRRFHPFSPSLDKVTPEEGYTKQNVRLVCTVVNLALNDFGEDIFERVCQAYLTKKAKKRRAFRIAGDTAKQLVGA